MGCKGKRMMVWLGAAALTLIGAGGLQAQLRYDTEWPQMNYEGARLSDPFSRLMRRVEAGEVELEYTGGRGFLDSLLEHLAVDPSSQVLVFSKTSQKRGLISAQTPRAIYFNDEVWVAFAQNGSTLEIAAMDPTVGPVFFTLAQDPAVPGGMTRETNRCLRCHDSFSLTGGGVPRFMMSSVLADERGRIVSHEINLITDTSTPLRNRFGGWFVTGSHGEQEHLGNLIIREGMSGIDLAATGNKQALDEFFDAAPYLTPHSDLVALLVMEHQVEAYNAITRAQYEARKALDAPGAEGEITATMEEIAEPLVQSLLMAHEAPLEGRIEGTAGFAAHFQSLGPFDDEGRSLRALDLEARTFEFPLSYLIYSDGFFALPRELKEAVYWRLNEILARNGGGEAYGHLDGDTRAAILEILRDTHAEFTRLVN